MAQIDVDVGPFWWEEWRGFPGHGEGPWREVIGQQRSNGRVVNSFHESPSLNRDLKWAPGNKYGYAMAPEKAYVRDGEKFYEACPHASHREFHLKHVSEDNPIKTKLRCHYPGYSPGHLDDFHMFNKLKNVTTTPAATEYTKYYQKECEAHQRGLENQGKALAKIGSSGTTCLEKKHSVNICNQAGLSLNECHYGSKDKIREQCIEKNVKNGKFNILPDGRYVFSFEREFNPNGARGICSDLKALKAYMDKLNNSGLTGQFIPQGISGTDFNAMTALHNMCKTVKVFDSKTGNESVVPLDGPSCTAGAVTRAIEKYDNNKDSWNESERTRIQNEKLIEQARQKSEADRKNQEALAKQMELQRAEYAKQTAALQNMVKSADTSNEIIKDLATVAPVPPPPPKVNTKALAKKTNAMKKDTNKDKKKDKKKETLFEKYKYVIMIVILLSVLGLLFLI